MGVSLPRRNFFDPKPHALLSSYSQAGEGGKGGGDAQDEDAIVRCGVDDSEEVRTLHPKQCLLYDEL